MSFAGKAVVTGNFMKRTRLDNTALKDSELFFSEDRFEQMEIENHSLKKRCRRLERIVSQLLENKVQVPVTELKAYCVPSQTRRPLHLPTESGRHSSSGILKHSSRAIKPVRDRIPRECTGSTDDGGETDENGGCSKSDLIAQVRLYAIDCPRQSTLESAIASAQHYPDIRDVRSNLTPPVKLHVPDENHHEYSSNKAGHVQPAFMPTVMSGFPTLYKEGSKKPKSTGDLANDQKWNEDFKREKEEFREVNGVSRSLEEIERQNEVFRSTYYESSKTSQARACLSDDSASPQADQVVESVAIYDKLLQDDSIVLASSPETPILDIAKYNSEPHRQCSKPGRFAASPMPDSSNKKGPKSSDHFASEYAMLASSHIRLQKSFSNLSELKTPLLVGSQNELKQVCIENDVPTVSDPRCSNKTPTTEPQWSMTSAYGSLNKTHLGRNRTHTYDEDEYARCISRSRSYHGYTNRPGTPSYGLRFDSENLKYNSDFYRKLPPKLHIVENQGNDGVTLTWNSTSSTDCSLVKNYHLFSRELFGYKVGTMKCVGIVRALPLPMSCNIDSLKPNVKYKFAVCAVDVYGRFGKMSNFTGKLEVKQKKRSEVPSTKSCVSTSSPTAALNTSMISNMTCDIAFSSIVK